MNSCENREKVLLNLKWFVHRFIKSFESKLLQSISCNTNSTIVSPRESSAVSPSTFSVLKSNAELNYLPNNSPLIRKLIEQQFKKQEKQWKHNSSYTSNCDLSNTSSESKNIKESSKNKIRSLTNSPLFRRLSLSNNQQKDSSLLSTDEKIDYCNGDSTGCDDDIDFKKIRTNYQGIQTKRKCFSNSQSPVFISFQNGITQQQKNNLFRFYYNSTESERFNNLSYFAQQLCVIYEYQLGMLKNLSSIYSVADYVADVLLKALKQDKISSINSEQLLPIILFYNDCKPASFNKIVKTSPLAVTGEQLSWRLGEIWTLPGIRHNEVGGENCHNLSIVTHFLSTTAPTGEISKSDVYGYRNLILLKSKLVSCSNKTNNNIKEKNDLNSLDDCNEHLSTFNEMNTFFKIASFDYSTIANSKINAGTIQDNVSPGKGISNYNNLPDNIHDQKMKNNSHSPDEKIKAKIKLTQISSSSAMLRQHIHRAYRPVFFVIYNRPTVIEHLTECESFASFCKRQSLSPVMFLNQVTNIFDKKPYPCIYQNFDLFRVSVAGYINKNDDETQEFTPKKFFNFNDSAKSNEIKNIAYFPYFGRKNITAYDNPGFTC